jgi:polyhydroxyalkanoate synthesis regulator phasin
MLETTNLSTNTQRIDALENQIRAAEVKIAVLQTSVKRLEAVVEASPGNSIPERIKSLERDIEKLNAHKLESEKRLWQYIFLAFGALLTVIGGILVSYLKRP